MLTNFSSSVLFTSAFLALATASPGSKATSSSASSLPSSLRGRGLSSAVTAAASIITDNNRIVGGDQSEEGEFPYYVEVGYGCGGALIAPQVMLYAAHCTPSLGKGTSVQVGAYRAQSTEYGVKRKCQKVVDHPKYDSQSMDNDFALCKLDKPVEISEDRAVLVLNDDDAVPATDEDLIVLGVGLLQDGGSSPQYLHNVTVPTVSNKRCNKKDYYNGGITGNMLCAGFEKGQKDSCQGDSGGPIVRRTHLGGGRFRDEHVGVVSWGYGCAAPKKPGVYARTSKGFQWIKTTVCDDFGAEATFCSGGDDNDNDNDSDSDSDDNDVDNESDDSVSPDDEDDDGDFGEFDDDFSGELDDDALEFDDDLFGGFDDDEFATPEPTTFEPTHAPTHSPTESPDCEDDPSAKIKGKANGCKKYVGKGKNKKIKKKCKKKHQGEKIYDICLETCGKVGLGECSHLKNA